MTLTLFGLENYLIGSKKKREIKLMQNVS